MIKKNLVSVIGTSYGNSQLEVIKSVKSVLAQNYSFIEFIVVVPKFKNNLNIFKKYKNIKIIQTSKLLNLPSSLNIALKYAQGEFVSRIDFDDYFDRNKLFKQVKFLKKNKNISILGTGYKDQKKKKYFIPIRGFILKVYTFFFNPVCHPSVLFRKKILNNAQFYNQKFDAAEDLELWLRFLSKNLRISNLNDSLIYYKKKKSLRSLKNFYFNLQARKIYSKKIFGLFFGTLNILMFHFLIKFYKFYLDAFKKK